MFKVRHPIVENQYCTIDEDTAESYPIAAGKVVKVTGQTSDRRAVVDVVSDAANDVAFGFLMQKVKDDYSLFPPGYRLRSDLGSSDAFKGDPVGVAHGHGAVYETDQYVDVSSDGITAGTELRVDDDGKLEDENSDSGPVVAIAMNTLTSSDVSNGKLLLIKALI